MTDTVRSRAEIARRVRSLADKRQREAARASRKVRAQLTAIASSYRALADELERDPSEVKAPAISPTQEDK